MNLAPEQTICLFLFVARGMIYYINGKPKSFLIQPTNLITTRANDFHEFTLGKPNSNSLKEQMLPMKIDNFVTWLRELTPAEINDAFDQGTF